MKKLLAKVKAALDKLDEKEKKRPRFTIFCSIFIVLCIIYVMFPQILYPFEYAYYKIQHPYHYKETYLDNASYKVGKNDFLYLDTCGQTAVANALNILTGTSDYNENDIVHITVDNGICIDGADAFDAGVIRNRSIAALVKRADPDDNVTTQVYNKKNALTVDEFADIVDDPKNVMIVRVDRNVLASLVSKTTNSWYDHLITVYDSVRDESGNVTGFLVVDPTYGIDAVTTEQFEQLYYASDDSEFDLSYAVQITYTK